MKKIIMALAILGVCACSNQADPLESAINAAITEQVHDASVTSIVYNEPITITDTTTIREELQTRRGVYEKRHRINTKYVNSYLKKGMKANAEKKQQDADRDLAILAALDALEAQLKDHLDDVLYYDCTFSAVVKTNSGEIELTPGFACFTPEYEVLGCSNAKAGIHKAVTKAIPGYIEAVNSVRNEESTEE